MKDRYTTYSNSQRSAMVMQVLLRTKYEDSEKVSAVCVKPNNISRSCSSAFFSLAHPLSCRLFAIPFSVGLGVC